MHLRCAPNWTIWVSPGEDIFELGTTAENYGENYGTMGKSMVDSTVGQDTQSAWRQTWTNLKPTSSD